MDFQVTATYPQGLGDGSSVDVRGNYRSVVGARLRRSLDEVLDTMKATTRYQTVKQADWSVVQVSSGDSITYRIQEPSDEPPLPVWLVMGTRPHTIRATNAPWLTFMGNEGHLVRVKEVHHPGTTGDQSLQIAWDQSGDRIGANLEEGMLAYVRALGDYTELEEAA